MIFIILVVLIALPILLLFLKGVFACCENKCSRCIDHLVSRVFWNSYIRFGLEAYLEFAISSMIRLKNFDFETASDKFHSIFSVLIGIFLISFIIFVTVHLQREFKNLAKPENIQKYGDLYLGLDTRKRTAMMVAVLFMLRRLLYAGVLVYLVNRSCFQIQFMILHCSLIMLYMGYFWPFKTHFSNVMETTNETLTLMCTYYLCLFTDFVPDAKARF